MQIKFHKQDINAIHDIAKMLARQFLSLLPITKAGAQITLQGELGVGKTEWSRAFIRAFGYDGVVKSPTYALVDYYELDNINIAHLDLYRLGGAQEFIDSGLDEYLAAPWLAIIEWAEIAGELLSTPALAININYDSQNNDLREVVINAFSEVGENILSNLKEIK